MDSYYRSSAIVSLIFHTRTVLKLVFEVASWYSEGQPASPACSFNPACVFTLFSDRTCSFFTSVMSWSFLYLAIVAQFVPHPVPDCCMFRATCLELCVILIHIQPKLWCSLCNNLSVFYFKTSLILLLLWVIGLFSFCTLQPPLALCINC